MKCTKCDGTGNEYWNGNVFCNTGFECDKCNGTGEIDITNEEWFCQLSTEEKAEWVTKNLSVYADDWVKSDEKLLNPATWVDWLNEVHK